MSFRLTKEQEAIVGCNSRIISVNAPHGTGKTSTIAQFIKRQLDDNRHSRIVVVTLTNSAAKSMSDAILRSRVEPQAMRSSLVIGTFHRFARRMLHKCAYLIGYREDFAVEPGIDDLLVKQLVKENRRRLKSWRNPTKVLSEINKKHVRSGRSITAIARQTIASQKKVEVVKRILTQLKKQKKAKGVMDFDDLLFYLWRLLRRYESVLKQAVTEYPVMVVDEFQDITHIQWKIIRLMVKQGMHLMCAGDECQTLYRFAWASLRRFRELRALPRCRELSLTQNFRTTNQIIQLSNYVISQSTSTSRKRVWSRKVGPKPSVILSPHKNLLVAAILNKIYHHLERGIPLDSMAVLFRFDHDASYLKGQLEKYNYPHIIFAKRGEKDNAPIAEFVTSVVEIIQNRRNKRAWGKVLPGLNGVGEKNSQTIMSWLQDADYQYHKLRHLPDLRFKTDLNNLLLLIQHTESLSREPRAALDVILDFYSGLKRKDGRRRLNGTAEATLQYIAKDSSSIFEMREDYEERPYDLWQRRTEGDSNTSLLTLSNIHQAKGREFGVVFLLGSDDRAFKRHDTFESQVAIDDEVMVMDTAITRTRRHLYLMFPMTVDDWQNKRHQGNPSIFIRRCPEVLYNLYSVESTPQQ